MFGRLKDKLHRHKHKKGEKEVSDQDMVASIAMSKAAEIMLHNLSNNANLLGSLKAVPKPAQPEQVKNEKSPSTTAAPSQPAADAPPTKVPIEAPTEKPPKQPDAPKDLWVEALNSLPESKQETLKKMGFYNDTAKSVSVESSIDDLVEVVNKKQEECEKKFWKVKVGDEEIVLRNYTNKIVDWLGKAGDIAVQFSPPQAAIPWAVIKSAMQVSHFHGRDAISLTIHELFEFH